MSFIYSIKTMLISTRRVVRATTLWFCFATLLLAGLNACEVVFPNTHPGNHDTINTMIWLPTDENWTGRFLGAGGFAVLTTDGGHAADAAIESWAQISPGNVNWNLFQTFASFSLDEATVLGRAVVEAYYGKGPTYSYWNECSQGGRQGHLMAQRFVDHYAGTWATGAGTNWAKDENKHVVGLFPTLCELDAIRVASIEACDALDDLKPAAPDDCTFDPHTRAGQTWEGAAFPQGKFLWYSLEPGAALCASVATTCNNGTCVGAPVGITAEWNKYFVTIDLSTVNIRVLDYLFHQSINRYDSTIGTSDTDLSYFQKAGGRLITSHGLADQLLPPGTLLNYVKRLHERDPNASNYYKYFDALGVDHCGLAGGKGCLIDWVEKGVAPDTLEAETQNAAASCSVDLCLWPKKLVYLGGDPDVAC
ncbi:tannase-domain-containing protein [Setomelanomma holmii]|uniref:Carboxylic ester hydrolase n=1 Tax=Setomelanomma holmii TaxID=210430 RepID=A0A9P4LJN9_9PLEO|nr:tannase-domain-containing protein [Setomelanomma holmii]